MRRPKQRTRKGTGNLDQALDQALRNRELREAGYREQALKLFPWICGRCGREFSGQRLQELTVHHKDHDHDNNPSDGSNWELLCTYCHDMEHAKYVNQTEYDEVRPGETDEPGAGHRPFANLEELLKRGK
jgi:5-methylcytosine-specific restriction endonuclease McrA